MESIYEAILNQLLEFPLLFCLVLAVVFAIGWQHFSREIKEIRKTLKEKADCETVQELKKCVYGPDNNSGIRREANETKRLYDNVVRQLEQHGSRIAGLEGNLNQVRCPNTYKNAMNGECDNDNGRSSILTDERDNYN